MLIYIIWNSKIMKKRSVLFCDFTKGSPLCRVLKKIKNICHFLMAPSVEVVHHSLHDGKVSA